jgi:exosortase/archaeosortase family protein
MPARISWRLFGFLALYGVLYALLSTFWSEGLSHALIDVATVKPAAWIARLVSSDPGIVAVGPRIQSPEASINVLFGCEGTDVFMLLAAALFVAPVSRRARLLGFLAGTALVFVVNQARVLALFYAFRRHREWFGPIHGLIGPMLVVLAVTLFYLIWLRWARSEAINGQGA